MRFRAGGRSERSTPEQNARPSARTTATRSSVAGSAENAASSTANISEVSALRFAGRESVTVRTAPETETVTSLLIGWTS